MRLTFRIKAFLFMALVLIAVSAVFTYETIQAQKEIARSEIIKRSEVFTILASKTGELAVLSRNEALLDSAATFLKGLSDVLFVVFYDNNMNLIAHKGMPVPNPQARASSGLSITYLEKDDYFDFFAPVYTEREKEDIYMLENRGRSPYIKEKIGVVRIGFSKAPMKAAEKKMVLRGLVLALIFIIGGGIVAYVFIALATRSLTVLYSATKKLTTGEYPEMKGISSNDEIGELATAFDKMSMAIKERESLLVESERQMRNLFERVEHAIFRLDANGGVIGTNRKFDELCGGKDNFSLLFPEERAGRLLKRAAAGELRHVEEKIFDKDGNELSVLISIYPDLDEKNNVTAYDGYFVDITAEKRLEESLMQTQKMESVGMLTGGIAHDFNNILAGILGYASLMKSLTPETDKNYRYIDI
ncbi:MAG: PAS domain S-box protein, partial [Syntrophales bacterium]|nr:PAS domain S-box protein [Syntrophales bacterium]